MQPSELFPTLRSGLGILQAMIVCGQFSFDRRLTSSRLAFLVIDCFARGLYRACLDLSIAKNEFGRTSRCRRIEHVNAPGVRKEVRLGQLCSGKCIKQGRFAELAHAGNQNGEWFVHIGGLRSDIASAFG
jgi:hypothetical protein